MTTPRHIPQWQQRVQSVAGYYDQARLVVLGRQQNKNADAIMREAENNALRLLGRTKA